VLNVSLVMQATHATTLSFTFVYFCVLIVMA